MYCIKELRNKGGSYESSGSGRIRYHQRDPRASDTDAGGGRMTEQWQELKETIIELRDNDGTGTQQEVCKFLSNLMDVLEKQMQEEPEEQEEGIEEP